MEIINHLSELRFFGKPEGKNLQMSIGKSWMEMNFSDAIATFFLNGVFHNVTWQSSEDKIIELLHNISRNPGGIEYPQVFIDGHTELCGEYATVRVKRIIFDTNRFK